MIRLYFVQMYSFLYGVLHDNLNINIRGLGYFLRIIDKDTILNIHGKKLYLKSKISIAYPRLISGQWAEPETHIFLKKIADQNKNIFFIDIGASVGEMVLDMADHKNVEKIFVFELDEDCIEVIQKNCKLNNHNNVRIYKEALSDIEEELYLDNEGTPQASLKKEVNNESNKKVFKTQTLDSFLHKIRTETILENPYFIILVDVEGYEFKVLKGAKKLIEKYNPLIIFEYHKNTREQFTLEDINSILPKNYKIFRLNRQGKLDNNLSNTWNCVAMMDKHNTI